MLLPVSIISNGGKDKIERQLYRVQGLTFNFNAYSGCMYAERTGFQIQVLTAY